MACRTASKTSSRATSRQVEIHNEYRPIEPHCDGPKHHNDQVLGPIFEADLPSELYAYRPGRNAQQVVVEVEDQLFRSRPDVEGMKSPLTRPLSPYSIWYTLFVKDYAAAHGVLQSAPVVDMYGISIRNHFGCTFRHFAFFTHIEMEWHRIS